MYTCLHTWRTSTLKVLIQWFVSDFLVRCGKVQWPPAWVRENQSAVFYCLRMAGSLHTRNQIGKFSQAFHPPHKEPCSVSVRDTTFLVSKQIVTANPWSSTAILCGVFMAFFKAANFAKLTIQWIIRMRKRHLRNKERELNQVTNHWPNVSKVTKWSEFYLFRLLLYLFCNQWWDWSTLGNISALQCSI